MSVPRAPGLGVAVDRVRLASVTLYAETFRDTELKESAGLVAALFRPGLSFALREGQPYNRATDPVSS